MADPRFFTRVGPFSLGELAELTGAQLGPLEAAGKLVEDVAPLESAGPADLSFLDNRKYVDVFAASRAGAAFVQPPLAIRAPPGLVPLLTEQPYRAYALAAQAFYPDSARGSGIASSAVMDPSARLGADVLVEHGAVIGRNVEIGVGCRVGANVVIADGVVIGDSTVIGPNASLSHCLIGARVRIYPGVRIGQDGFGFAMGPEGHLKVPQLGRVIVEDDVEIGANSTVDRGAGPDTVIGRGTIIDNLVQIGHNVQIGPHCVIVAQSGVSGSTRLGPFVIMAAQSGLAGHLSVGAGAQIGAKAGIMRDVPAGARILGVPGVPAKQFFRQVAVLERLAKGKGDSDG